MKMAIPNTVSLNFEDDVMIHNHLLEKISLVIDKRITNTYEIDNSFKAVKAIASLIETKANRQKMILDSAIVNTSSTVEISK
jgi:hypothetical protein